MSGAPPLFATSYRFRFGMRTVIFSSGQPGALACLAWPASHTWHAHAWNHVCCRYYSTWLWTSSDNVAKRRVSTRLPGLTADGAMAVLSEIIRVWNPARNRRSNSTRRPHNRIRPSTAMTVPVSPPPGPWAKKACGFSKSTHVATL